MNEGSSDRIFTDRLHGSPLVTVPFFLEIFPFFEDKITRKYEMSSLSVHLHHLKKRSLALEAADPLVGKILVPPSSTFR